MVLLCRKAAGTKAGKQFRTAVDAKFFIKIFDMEIGRKTLPKMSCCFNKI